MAVSIKIKLLSGLKQPPFPRTSFFCVREPAQTPEYTGQVPLVDQVTQRLVHERAGSSVHLEKRASDASPGEGRRKDRPYPIRAARDGESERTFELPLALHV